MPVDSERVHSEVVRKKIYETYNSSHGFSLVRISSRGKTHDIVTAMNFVHYITAQLP